MSQAARIMHLSNNKLNAAGLTPDHSLVLPERTAQVDEVAVLQAMTEVCISLQRQIKAIYADPFSATAVYRKAGREDYERLFTTSRLHAS
jgi:hypothetical protein